MNLKPSKFSRQIMPMFALFTVINVLVLLFTQKLSALNINADVIIFGNALLFLLSLIAFWLISNSTKNKNPNVFVRTVMATTLIKLLVIATSVFIYVRWAKEHTNNISVIITMGLYIVYTFIEVKTIVALQKKSTNNANK